jgi:beta-glucanase (GH16 family)
MHNKQVKMKRFMLNTLLLSLAAALWGCGGSDNDDAQPAAVTITASQENINVPAEGGSYTVSVTTTGKEWGAYADADFISVDAKNTTSQTGTLIVTVKENPTTAPRTGGIVLMSGSARRTITVLQDAAAQSAYNAPEGYTLVWQDEFDKGSELNPDDWTHEVKNAGWVNHELQNYVNHKTPEGNLVTEVRGGKLRITALKENGKVYSGRVYAKVREGWQYGYIEASIKLPKGKGTWPAFWMMPVNFHSWPADGEIDIMEEVGYHPNYVSSSLHANAHVHSNNTQITHEMLCQGAEGEFHTYAILWTSKNITTYVDGKVQLTYDNRGLGRDDWPYDDPFYVILNLAWGGDWGGAQGVDESALPATMEIDYVRVFQKR